MELAWDLACAPDFAVLEQHSPKEAIDSTQFVT
jgi:hypothetical protein